MADARDQATQKLGEARARVHGYRSLRVFPPKLTLFFQLIYESEGSLVGRDTADDTIASS